SYLLHHGPRDRGGGYEFHPARLDGARASGNVGRLPARLAAVGALRVVAATRRILSQRLAVFVVGRSLALCSMIVIDGTGQNSVHYHISRDGCFPVVITGHPVKGTVL